MNFCTFRRLKFTRWTKYTAPKMAKTAVFALLEFTKLISRKISVIQKSWNFHAVDIVITCHHWNEINPQALRVAWLFVEVYATIGVSVSIWQFVGQRIWHGDVTKFLRALRNELLLNDFWHGDIWVNMYFLISILESKYLGKISSK